MELILSNIFYEIAMLLLVAAAVGVAAQGLRQPLIVAFIAVGIFVGPAGMGWVRSHDQIDLLATLGISLLLFVVGLKLDLNLIRSLGRVALATGLGQVLFTSVIGYVIVFLLGMDHIPAVYIAVALTFSSTIIVVKLLSDKREIDALHGRIAVGFLIVQDVVVVLAMIALSALGAASSGGSLIRDIALVIVKGLAMLVATGLLMRYLLPALLHRLARSSELLVLFGIAWAVVFAAIGDLLGFSKEVGAFLAGMSIASTPYREALSTRLTSLRDFLLLFFFISLGAQVEVRLLDTQILPAVVLSLFVLIGNPLIVMVIMGAMGYRKRTGFLAGLTVAQISEFSLVFAALGLSLGHIGTDTVGLITLVGLVTIGLSTYLIIYSHRLYEWLAPYLGSFERHVPHREQAIEDGIPASASVDVILFGLGRYGGGIAHGLRLHGLAVLGVDFDPEEIASWRRKGYLAVYGDAEDQEFPATLPLAHARWVVCTVPSRDVNLALRHALRAHNFRGKLALTAYNAHDKLVLESQGADLVLRPFTTAAEQTAVLLSDSMRSHTAPTHNM